MRSKGFWKDAYRYNRQAGLAQQLNASRADKAKLDLRPRMFTSLMDWLDPKAPIEWLADFLKVIHDCQNLDWLLLTKRPELWRERVNNAFLHALSQLGDDERDSEFRNWLEVWFNDSFAPANVWFGVTVENQEMADKRIPELLKIPAKVRWLSVEPLLGSVNLTEIDVGEVCKECGKRVTASAFSACAHCDCCVEGDEPICWGPLHWVVVGGESGSKRRDCGVDAIYGVVEQCQLNEVPVFVKQDCAGKPGQQGRLSDRIWSLKQYPVCR